MNTFVLFSIMLQLAIMNLSLANIGDILKAKRRKK